MESVRKCEHYQRNCKYAFIQVIFKLLAAKYSIHVNYAMMKILFIKKDVKLKEWNFHLLKKLNA
jgi:hypothetical protein